MANKPTAANSLPGTTDHDLSDLTGKRIKRITVQEVDVHGNGENIRQFFHILCSDGERFVLSIDGHNTQQYVTASLMDPGDFTDFLESIGSDDDEDDDPAELGAEDDEESFDDDRLFDDDEEDPDLEDLD